jgi:hypothetical protein
MSFQDEFELDMAKISSLPKHICGWVTDYGYHNKCKIPEHWENFEPGDLPEIP